MENNELYQVLEAIVLCNSLSLYMNKLSEHRAHPDFEATMRFLGHIYRKFAKVADQRVTTNEMGRTVLRRDIRSKFDLN